MAIEAAPFREKLGEAANALVAETEYSKRYVKRVDGHMLSFRPQVKNLESAESLVMSTIENANKAVRKAQEVVDLSQESAELLKKTVSSMEGSAVVLQGKIEALEQMQQAPAEA